MAENRFEKEVLKLQIFSELHEELEKVDKHINENSTGQEVFDRIYHAIGQLMLNVQKQIENAVYEGNKVSDAFPILKEEENKTENNS